MKTFHQWLENKSLYQRILPAPPPPPPPPPTPKPAPAPATPAPAPATPAAPAGLTYDQLDKVAREKGMSVVDLLRKAQELSQLANDKGTTVDDLFSPPTKKPPRPPIELRRKMALTQQRYNKGMERWIKGESANEPTEGNAPS